MSDRNQTPEDTAQIAAIFFTVCVALVTAPLALIEVVPWPLWIVALLIFALGTHEVVLRWEKAHDS